MVVGSRRRRRRRRVLLRHFIHLLLVILLLRLLFFLLLLMSGFLARPAPLPKVAGAPSLLNCMLIPLPDRGNPTEYRLSLQRCIGTAQQDAECGHIRGRARERSMWTHRWQNVSYYLRQFSTDWEWGPIQTHCEHISGRSYERAMWTHRWQSAPSYLLRLRITEDGGGGSDIITARHNRTPNVDT